MQTFDKIGSPSSFEAHDTSGLPNQEVPSRHRLVSRAQSQCRLPPRLRSVTFKRCNKCVMVTGWQSAEAGGIGC